jgi:hypothetical protein
MRTLRAVLGLSLALVGAVVARAQAPKASPPNILYIETDNIKPYQTAPYDKVAAEYPSVSEQFKQTTHYRAMEAMTGAPRADYFFGYDSYEAFQKDIETTMGHAALKARFEALDARESPYVAEVHNTLWHYRPDLSNNVDGADIPHSHYYELIIFHMRSGHDEAFEDLTKLYRDANVKSGQNTPWAAFEALSGAQDAFLVGVPMTSLKDEDAGLTKESDFMAAMGDEGMKKMSHLTEEGVAGMEDNIWMVNPEASYVRPEWVAADPKYWTHKPAAKPAARPAGAAAAPQSSR